MKLTDIQKHKLKRVPILSMLNTETFEEVVSTIQDIVGENEDFQIEKTKYKNFQQRVKSFSDGNKYYLVSYGPVDFFNYDNGQFFDWNEKNYTCNCPAFTFSNVYYHCKHIREVITHRAYDSQIS